MPFLDTSIHNLLDIIFPTKCMFCGQRDTRGMRGADLCLDCLSDAPGAERESAEWIFPLYDYRHPAVKKSLWLLKYKGKKRLAKVFAETLYEKILEELSELSVMENFTDPILVPVPLSPKRHRERGYNQAELLCREIVKIWKRNHLSLPFDKLRAPLSLLRRGVAGEVGILNTSLILENKVLVKPKDTEHQTRIKDRRERLKNIRGSFAARDSGKIKGRNIILIDDILTTGATLGEARKVLRQNGARKVIAFTVAH